MLCVLVYSEVHQELFAAVFGSGSVFVYLLDAKDKIRTERILINLITSCGFFCNKFNRSNDTLPLVLYKS